MGSFRSDGFHGLRIRKRPVTLRTKPRVEPAGAQVQNGYVPRLVPNDSGTSASLGRAAAARNRKRLGRLEVLDHCAEVDRLRIERPIFGDLAAIEHVESIALEHFFTAPAFKSHDLPVDPALAGPVKVAQVR